MKKTFLLLFVGVSACSSSSSDAVPDGSEEPDGSAADTTGPVDTNDAKLDASREIEGDSSAPRDTASLDGSRETTSDASSTPDASEACVKFCDCMKVNCAEKKFVTDCLTDCAMQTHWDLPCRANMCSLVPAQPDNDHCTHAMGVSQCLDHT